MNMIEENASQQLLKISITTNASIPWLRTNKKIKLGANVGDDKLCKAAAKAHRPLAWLVVTPEASLPFVFKMMNPEMATHCCFQPTNVA